jgi:CBS domain-containing protein
LLGGARPGYYTAEIFKGKSKHGSEVSDVVRHKGNRVVTVMPQQTVAAAVQLLAKNRIGAAPVVDEQGSSRWNSLGARLIRGISENAGGLLALPVDHLMTVKPRPASKRIG